MRHILKANRCGKYVLHDRLNQGGMAELFLASKDHEKMVAIRRLQSKFKYSFFKRREFMRGLKIQARLHHPQIVRVLKLEGRTLLPYAVMEYVEGVNLRQAMLRKNEFLQDPLSVFDRMLHGLYHIHRHGFIHLDFKPENVFLDHDGHVKILDFDLAQPISKHSRVFSTINGTPAYLAPEQILKEPVDERADIFALGITACELFTGSKPFLAQTTGEIFEVYKDLDRPFSPLTRPGGKLHYELSRILAHCVEKKVQRRYPSIPMILQDLREARLLSGTGLIS